MKISKKKITDEAVVGVVTAILLVGVIVAVFSLVQTMYIPKIMEQREADHMDKVAEQFTYLTSVIDGQAANPTNTMPIATSITLGSKELPYMLSMKAFGTLEILDAERSERSIIITTGSGINTYDIGVITYSSMNGYFLDQTYTYEAGAMIVSQTDEGNMMMIRPSFSIKDNIITFDVVNIRSIGSKTIASGYGMYPIQTELSGISTNVTFTDVSTLTINTPLSNAWSVFLNSALYNTSPPYTLQFRVIDINAQIGPGWVE